MNTCATLDFTAIDGGRSTPAPSLRASLSWGRLGDVARVSAALVLVSADDTLALLLSGNSKSLVVFLDMADRQINAEVRRWAKAHSVELALAESGKQVNSAAVRLHVDLSAQDWLERYGTAPNGAHRVQCDKAGAIAANLSNTSMTDWCELDVVKEVPVTRPLLSIARVVQAAFELYRAESALAADLGLQGPRDAKQRCENMFFQDMLHQRAAVGLPANRMTLDALLRMPLAAEMTGASDDELPKRFTFHTRTGVRRTAAYRETLAA